VRKSGTDSYDRERKEATDARRCTRSKETVTAGTGSHPVLLFPFYFYYAHVLRVLRASVVPSFMPINFAISF